MRLNSHRTKYLRHQVIWEGKIYNRTLPLYLKKLLVKFFRTSHGGSAYDFSFKPKKSLSCTLKVLVGIRQVLREKGSSKMCMKKVCPRIKFILLPARMTHIFQIFNFLFLNRANPILTTLTCLTYKFSVGHFFSFTTERWRFCLNYIGTSLSQTEKNFCYRLFTHHASRYWVNYWECWISETSVKYCTT